MSKEYKGRCHCGSVQFNVVADLNNCFKCNCSFCVRRASTLVKVEDSKFTLESDENNLGKYGSRDFSDHFFCKNCGIQCYTRFKNEKGTSVILNVGCLEGVDSYSLNPVTFDGAKKL
ncbi:GFA family protein [Marinobacter sp. CHS3-4]|uniref:GFA family protein n=1 Tax=Marinobacter sp. CHS3-4 TaxID=3045174 RepID=UPI0024B53837|nr:GFA family protein [Marinobacter sp. CHS3-4]MDI9246437.1 GFA family protein [Marinobacter sp. CHS3-4]